MAAADQNARTERIRAFLLANVARRPRELVRVAAARFRCSRQAMHRHVQRLVAEGALVAQGSTRSRIYALAVLREWRRRWPLAGGTSEDEAWSAAIGPQLADLGPNARGIWLYGFSELFNNAIDHSEGRSVTVGIRRTGAATEMTLRDDGVGVFRKVQAALRLPDERLAGLELAKGKFTTDPKRHSGQGIFFAARMFDSFRMVAGNLELVRTHGEPEQWFVRDGKPGKGTAITLTLANGTSRTTRSVFDRFSSGEDYAFTTTCVPVRLLQTGADPLVSRSQAKRLLARAESFQRVVLDFTGVADIGQAFADEAFRVFPLHHPGTTIEATNAGPEVTRMMRRALAGR
jgi:hypothetical protein